MVDPVLSRSVTLRSLGSLHAGPAPAPSSAGAAPTTELPLGPVPPHALPRHQTHPHERGGSVNAVVLGLAAIPATLVAFYAPAGAHAQAPLPSPAQGTGDTAAVSLARSQLFAARTTAEDPHITELTQKIAALVDAHFDGDQRAAFDHYAGADGKVNRSELSRLLSDADVGNFLTRGAWVSGIMERLDTNHDAKISWGEFQAVMAAPRAA